MIDKNPWNPNYDQNTPETKITPKPKKKMIDKNPWNPNYDQNTPETKITPKPKKNDR